MSNRDFFLGGGRGGGVNNRQLRALKIRLIIFVKPLAELFPLVSFIASVLL